MSAGIGNSGFKEKLWTITDLDRSEDIIGQYIGQNVTHNISAKLARRGSYNSQYPIIQWVAGELETISFNAKFFAHDATDFSVDDRLERMIALVQRNNDFKKPPICAFTLGDVASLSVECLVRSIGGITYDEVRDDGTLRGVTLQISLERYQDVEFTATDPTVPPSYTRIRRARKGDSYESIALDEYGDPELGIIVRQLNPRLPGMQLSDLKSGDQIHIFPESYLNTFPIEPEFHAFKTGPDNEAAEQRRRDLFVARSGDSYTTIFSDNTDKDFL